MQFAYNDLPVAHAVSGSLSALPTREEQVLGPAPGDLETVSGPKHMLVQSIPTRAKPPVKCVAPNREAKW